MGSRFVLGKRFTFCAGFLCMSKFTNTLTSRIKRDCLDKMEIDLDLTFLRSGNVLSHKPHPEWNVQSQNWHDWERLILDLDKKTQDRSWSRPKGWLRTKILLQKMSPDCWVCVRLDQLTEVPLPPPNVGWGNPMWWDSQRLAEATQHVSWLFSARGSGSDPCPGREETTL